MRTTAGSVINDTTHSLGFGHIYVLSMRGNLRRRAHMQQVLQAYQVNFSIFDAADGENESDVSEDMVHGFRRKISQIQLQQVGSRAHPHFASLSAPAQFNVTLRWRRAVVACFVSHLRILQDARLQKFESYLVFEDDAEPAVNVAVLKSTLHGLHHGLHRWPGQWRLAYLGYNSVFNASQHCRSESFDKSKPLNKVERGAKVSSH